MRRAPKNFSISELKSVFRPFCEKHKILRLDVFGSAGRAEMVPGSDVDLLLPLDASILTSANDLLEMAGEAEELVGTPVDFVLRSSLEKSSNHYARDHILSSAVCLYAA